MPISIVSIKRVIVALVSILALLGFVALVINVLYQTLYAETPYFGSMQVFWVNSLAGLVGGVVATGFGQAPPPQVMAGNLVERNASGVGGLVAPPELQPAPPTNAAQPAPGLGAKAPQIIGLLYATVYIVLGFASIAVVIIAEQKGDAPDLAKGLATVSGGLIVAIIGAFFAGN